MSHDIQLVEESLTLQITQSVGIDVTLNPENAVLNFTTATPDLVLELADIVRGPPGPQGPAGEPAVYAQGIIIPTANQTVFQLPEVPVPFSLALCINGQELIFGYDYTLSGTTVTLLEGLGYNLSITDLLQYQLTEAT